MRAVFNFYIALKFLSKKNLFLFYQTWPWAKTTDSFSRFFSFCFQKVILSFRRFCVYFKDEICFLSLSFMSLQYKDLSTTHTHTQREVESLKKFVQKPLTVGMFIKICIIEQDWWCYGSHDLQKQTKKTQRRPTSLI